MRYSIGSSVSYHPETKSTLVTMHYFIDNNTYNKEMIIPDEDNLGNETIRDCKEQLRKELDAIIGSELAHAIHDVEESSIWDIDWEQEEKNDNWKEEGF